MSEIDVMRGRIQAIEQQQELVRGLDKFLSSEGSIFVIRDPEYQPLEDRLKISLSGHGAALMIESVKEKLQDEESKLREMVAGLTAPL